MTAAPTITLPKPWVRKHLGAAEQRVVALAAAGLSNKEIARQLGKATLTVRNQLVRAMRKLGVKSRYELISRLKDEKPPATEIPDCGDSSYAI